MPKHFKTKAILFFLLLLCVMPFNKALARFDFNPRCVIIYNNIINLKFKNAQVLIDQEKKTDPSNVIPLYLENYIGFLSLMITENTTSYPKIKQEMEQRLEKISKDDATSPYYLYCQSDLNLQIAFLRLRYEEYVTAILNIRKSYNQISDNQKKFPNFILNKKILGLLHIMIGSVPKEYQWSVNLMSLKGTIKQGFDEMISLMKTTDNNYTYVKPELAFYLTFTQNNIIFNEDEVKHIKAILDEYNSNNCPLLIFAIASMAMRAGENDQAIHALSYRPKSDEYFPFDYLDFMMGAALLNKLDKNSHLYFEKYLACSRSQNYKKAALQKLAWYYLLNGNLAKYQENISKVKTTGKNIMEEDRQAQKEAESNKVPNLILLKTRLLTDGGYYEQALNTLMEKQLSEFCKTLKEQIEYTYRLGRIFHKWEKPDRAIPYYEMTIKNGASTSYYFVANSVVQLGLIYEKKKDLAKARTYYEKAMKMDPEEYKESIQYKAKAGLNRINNK